MEETARIMLMLHPFCPDTCSGVAKGGEGGDRPPQLSQNCSHEKSKSGEELLWGGGGVYILSTESQLHLYDENQFTWNY